MKDGEYKSTKAEGNWVKSIARLFDIANRLVNYSSSMLTGFSPILQGYACKIAVGAWSVGGWGVSVKAGRCDRFCDVVPGAVPLAGRHRQLVVLDNDFQGLNRLLVT